MIRSIVFGVLVAGLLAAATEAEEYNLKVKKIKANAKTIELLPEVELRPGSPSGLMREPKYRSRQPIKFVQRFGGGEDIAVVFAADEKMGNGEGYDYLYVDVEGQGDLAAGKKVNGKRKARDRIYFDTLYSAVEIKLPEGNGYPTFPVFARLSTMRNSVNDSSLYLTPLIVLEGEVKFDGEARKVMVFDANCNAVFGDLDTAGGRGGTQGDKIWIGKKKMKPEVAYGLAIPFSRFLLQNDGCYEVEMNADGGSHTIGITMSEVPMGTIELEEPGFILTLNKGDTLLTAASEDEKTIQIPAGRYQVCNADFLRKHRGKLWKLEGRAGTFRQNFDVAESGTTSVTLGPPLKIKVNTSLGPNGNLIQANLSFAIEGQGGETYSFLRMNGKKVDLPEIQIKDPGNKVVKKGRFSYG